MNQHRLSPSGAPLGGIDLGGVCAVQTFAPNAGDTAQVADFDLEEALNTASVLADEPLNTVTIAGRLTMATIRNVDGQFPQVRIYAVTFWLDADGNVIAPSLVDGLFQNNLETGVADTAYGGLTNYGDGNGITPIAMTSLGTDQVLTFAMTGSQANFPGATGKLCLDVAHPAIPVN